MQWFVPNQTLHMQWEFEQVYVKTREGSLGNIKEDFQVFFVALLLIDYDTKEDQDWTECWTCMALLMHIGLEIWIVEDLQVGMCLNYLEEQSIG
jgi:hypothetical protein